MLKNVQYQKIDDEGLHILHEDSPQVLPVDHVVVCAGQEPLQDLATQLQGNGLRVHLIGGAFEARELDAKRAIEQAAELASKI